MISHLKQRLRDCQLGMFAAVALVLCSLSPAQAVSLIFTSDTDLIAIPEGQTFQITVSTSSDFPTFNQGGFGISYDPNVVSYIGGALIPPTLALSDGLLSALDTPGSVPNISFFGLGIGPSTDVLTLSFTADTPGTTDLVVAEAATPPLGFPTVTGEIFFPTLSFTVVPIPLPTSGLLLVISLGLFGLRAMDRSRGMA